MTALHDAPLLPPVNNALIPLELQLAHDPEEEPQRIERGKALADPTAVVCTVAHAALEVVHGTRPVQQIASLVSPAILQLLMTKVRAQQKIDYANGVSRHPHASTNSTGKDPARRPPARIIKARIARISAVAAEASVLIHDGEKVRATALRAEEFRGRWRVNVLQIG
ncbi:Rv3235 family protein [Timonella sp. A28]|uniref:Rv3235 family protein n=1 Tax=Timonella sp. A28 TaxID=3442640 RepID=UPI003EBEEC95